MHNLKTMLKNLSNSTKVFNQNTQPYYIVTPPYSDKSAGIRLLHQLCSLLNKLGYEAYVTSDGVDGQLWTPVLTGGTKTSHYLAKKKPIVIYPEIIKGHPLNLGLPVRYALYFPGKYGEGDATYPPTEIIYKHRDLLYPTGDELHLPIVDLDLFYPPKNNEERTLTLVYYNRYRGKLMDHGDHAIHISPKTPIPHRETAELYRKAKILYAYEGSTATIEARLCGCPVILIPNQEKLPTLDDDQKYYGTSGLGWGMSEESIRHATETVKYYRDEYINTIKTWKDQLISFIQKTQALANDLPLSTAWPQEAVDELNGIFTEPRDLAERADRIKWRRVHAQYEDWMKKTTLREIDATVYAEHVEQGHIQQLDVIIDNRHGTAEDIADTIDSLGQCLGSPAKLIIVSNTPAPEFFSEDTNIQWITDSEISDKSVHLKPSSKEPLI